MHPLPLWRSMSRRESQRDPERMLWWMEPESSGPSPALQKLRVSDFGDGIWADRVASLQVTHTQISGHSRAGVLIRDEEPPGATLIEDLTLTGGAYGVMRIKPASIDIATLDPEAPVEAPDYWLPEANNWASDAPYPSSCWDACRFWICRAARLGNWKIAGQKVPAETARRDVPTRKPVQPSCACPTGVTCCTEAADCPDPDGPESDCQVAICNDNNQCEVQENPEECCVVDFSDPEDEICDGVDANCSGTPDDGFQPQPDTRGFGPCTSTGETVCTGGVLATTCEAGVPEVQFDTVCNGIDDDCDNNVDEDFDPVSSGCDDGDPCTSSQCLGGECTTILTGLCNDGKSLHSGFVLQ